MGDITLVIAQQIKKNRERLKLSKKELSKELGVAPSTVSGWENGEYAPGADTLIKLCDLFKITLDDIYGKNQSEQKEMFAYQLNSIEAMLVDAFRDADSIAQFKAAKELGIDLPEPVEPIVMIAHGGTVEKIYVSDEVQEEILKILEKTPQYKFKK